MTVIEQFWSDLLRQLPCILRGRVPGTCEREVHSHHVAEGSGLRSEFAKVRLCWGHHEGPAGFHPTVGGRGSKEFIRQYRPPGDSEYGLIVWQIEDVASYLRRERPGLQDLAGAIERAAVSAYRAGMKNGIREYAVWKNGEQLVGALRRPLKEVLAAVDAVQDKDIVRCLPPV